MLHIEPAQLPDSSRSAPLSPLMLGDRLISLAKDADRVGLPEIAHQLIQLACDVLEAGRELPPGPAKGGGV
jgi:hypothetical protein